MNRLLSLSLFLHHITPRPQYVILCKKGTYLYYVYIYMFKKISLKSSRLTVNLEGPRERENRSLINSVYQALTLFSHSLHLIVKYHFSHCHYNIQTATGSSQLYTVYKKPTTLVFIIPMWLMIMKLVNDLTSTVTSYPDIKNSRGRYVKICMLIMRLDSMDRGCIMILVSKSHELISFLILLARNFK